MTEVDMAEPTLSGMKRRRGVTQAQWLMARKLHDGIEPPAKSRIAAILGVYKSAVTERATAEGWRQMDHLSRDAQAAYSQAAEVAAGIRDNIDGGEGASAEDPSGAGYDEASPDFLANAGAFVSRHIARIIARADRNGGRLDKAQIDGLVSLLRMAERWEAAAAEKAIQDIRKSDDELAAMLARIDERIIELGKAYAEQLVAAHLRDGEG